jgi:hypothetical protein
VPRHSNGELDLDGKTGLFARMQERKADLPSRSKLYELFGPIAERVKAELAVGRPKPLKPQKK